MRVCSVLQLSPQWRGFKLPENETFSKGTQILAGGSKAPVVFGKKPTPVSQERLSAALRSTVPSDKINSTRRGPRADRKSTWATCVLVWEPRGREEGVCVDISETGARIRFRNKPMIPGKFHFVSAKLGINFPAEFIRQDGNDIAIRFVLED